MTDRLTDAIRVIIDESQRLGAEAFEDALSAITDDLEADEKDGALYADNIIDGIRWGSSAAILVELGRGAMLRVCLPDGVRITHEWANHNDANPQINAALAAVMADRVKTEGVGK